MAEIRHGGDTLRQGLDRILHGGAPQVHTPNPNAAMVHTVCTLISPSRSRINLWTGNGDVVVPGTAEDLRLGRTGWRYDPDGGRDLSDILTQTTPNTRITAAAQDPLLAGRAIIVSSTDRCYWLVNLNTGIVLRTVIDERPSWLPADHGIYPIGGADFLRDGTLIIACWAGRRIVDPAAVDGIRHTDGRWCFYLKRIRNPLPEPDRPDEDGNPITFPKVLGAPELQSSPAVITRPFPLRDNGIRYDFSKFIAKDGREMRDASLSDRTIRLFGYSDDVPEGLDVSTGVQVPGFHQFVLKSEAFTDAASVEDDYIPQRIEDEDGALLTKLVLGAPSWGERLNLRGISDDGERSFWLTEAGNVRRFTSVAAARPAGAYLTLLTEDPLRFIHRSHLPVLGNNQYRAIMIRGDADLWFFRRFSPVFDRLTSGVTYSSRRHKLVSVSPIAVNEGVDDTQRLRIVIDIQGQSRNATFVNDLGQVEVQVDYIISLDSGATWRLMGRGVRGRVGAASFVRGIGGGFRPEYNAGLSFGSRGVGTPQFQSGAGEGYFWTLEVHTLDSDVFRGSPRYFSDSDQQERYTGDRFFERLGNLEDALSRWGQAAPEGSA